jgi:uncharacterized protein
MNRSFSFRLQMVLLGVIIAVHLGCAGSTPTARFYTLNPQAMTGEAKSEKETSGKELTIGIGPVHLPQYLDEKEIVTRTNANKIDRAEFDLWGGTLQDEFARNLLENLSLLLKRERISLFLMPGVGTFDYRVGVDVIRFDGKLGGDVVLNATWTIRQGRELKLIQSRNSRIQEPTGGQGYEAMVAGMSRALGRLSQDIGTEIRALSR